MPGKWRALLIIQVLTLRTGILENIKIYNFNSFPRSIFKSKILHHFVQSRTYILKQKTGFINPLDILYPNI